MDITADFILPDRLVLFEALVLPGYVNLTRAGISVTL